MIYTLFFRRYAPFAKFGYGFEGDNRTSASTSMKDTARTTGSCEFGANYIGSGFGSSSGSSYMGLGSKAAKKFGRHYSHVTASVAVETKTLSIVRFTAYTAGGNPMVPSAPEIDTFVDFTATFGASTIFIEGTVRGDDFPNAEVFVYDNNGHAVILFTYATEGGRNTGPFTSLSGKHEKQVLGKFSKSIPILSTGSFRKL